MCWICNAKTSLSPAPRQPAGRSMWSPRRAFLLAAGSAAAAPVLGQVDVGRSSSLRTLVPAEALEQASQKEYSELMAQARAQRALGPDNHPQVRRLRSIASRLIPHTAQWNDRARGWRWEVNLIGSQQINAYCMPGGKIAFFSGILDQLKLSDHEVAMIMGHEMAHALREHARERIAKTQATGLGLSVAASLFGLGQLGELGANIGTQLLSLKYSRDDETEADGRQQAPGRRQLPQQPPQRTRPHPPAAGQHPACGRVVPAGAAYATRRQPRAGAPTCRHAHGHAALRHTHRPRHRRALNRPRPFPGGPRAAFFFGHDAIRVSSD